MYIKDIDDKNIDNIYYITTNLVMSGVRTLYMGEKLLYPIKTILNTKKKHWVYNHTPLQDTTRYKVDFRHLRELRVNVCDEKGEDIKVDGCVILELDLENEYEIYY